jgi:hypothetical protein
LAIASYQDFVSDALGLEDRLMLAPLSAEALDRLRSCELVEEAVEGLPALPVSVVVGVEFNTE